MHHSKARAQFLGFRGAILGLSWGHPGNLEASMRHLGAILHLLGGAAAFGAGSVLPGGHLRAILGPLRAIFRPSWGYLETIWGRLGSVLGHVKREEVFSKNVHIPQARAQVLGFQEAVLRPSWSHFRPS